MFSKTAGPEAAPHDLPPGSGNASRSVLGPDLRITGEIASSGAVEVLGQIDGNLAAASLTVGAGGRLSGSVRATAVEVLGQLDGKVDSQSVVVRSTARVTADIGYSDLTIENGAQIEGHLTRPQG